MRSKKSKNRQNKSMYGGFSKDFQGVFAITVLALLVIIIGIMIYHIYNNSKDAVEHSNLSPQNNCILPTKITIEKIQELATSGLENKEIGGKPVININSYNYDIEKFKKHIKKLFSHSIFDQNCAFPEKFGIGHIIYLVNSGLEYLLEKKGQLVEDGETRALVIPNEHADYNVENFIKNANDMFTK